MSLSLEAENRRDLSRVRVTCLPSRRSALFAHLDAELGGFPARALVRRDGSASGNAGWLRRAADALRAAVPLLGARPSADPLLTVLSLTRTCDRVTGLDLFDAGDRGVYPCAGALASMDPAWRPLTIEVDEWGDLHVVRLKGELDFASVTALHEQLGSLRCSTLQFDLAELTFCDATGLSALVATKRQRELDGCRVTIVGAKGIVRRVFELTGLAHTLDD